MKTRARTWEERAAPASADERVLVLAPFGRDAAALAAALANADRRGEPCADADDLRPKLAEGVGCLLLTEEALTPRVVAAVADFLHAQPPWSDLPLLVLLGHDGRRVGGVDALRARHPDLNLTALVRPLRAVALVSAVAAALRARRQYEIRDHLLRHRRSEERQRRLVRELNHRVKNTLATVLSIAAHTLHQSGSLEAFGEGFEGRVQALARVHEALARNAWHAATLREVAELSLAPYVDGRSGNVDLTGPGLWLRPEAGLSLSMYLHELATNAAKYGALSAPSGRVVVDWRVEGGDRGGDGPRLRVRWSEADGPRVRQPSRRGFGTRLIERAVAYELDGRAELSFREEGLVCTFDVPLDAVALPESAETRSAGPFPEPGAKPG